MDRSPAAGLLWEGKSWTGQTNGGGTKLNDHGKSRNGQKWFFSALYFRVNPSFWSFFLHLDPFLKMMASIAENSNILNSEFPQICFETLKSVQKQQFFQKYRHLKNRFWIVFGPISPNIQLLKYITN